MTIRSRRWLAAREPLIAVSENAGVRYLHIGGDAIQSAMRLAAPETLELHYTRAMMAFQLFHPRPRRVLMIGLGGGSMVRFLRHAHPKAVIQCLEVSPEVVRVARLNFGLHEDDDRLAVTLEDGATWVPRHPSCADVVLLDAFDDGDQVPALCETGFYRSVHAALTEPGVLVQNFMADDRKFDRRIAAMEEAFGRHATLIQAADRVNMIALIFRGGPQRIAWRVLQARADVLRLRHQLPGSHFLASLRRLNGGTESFLTL